MATRWMRGPGKQWLGPALLLFMISAAPISAQNKLIGDEFDGSRTTPIHVIRLIDQDSSVIWLGEQPLMPFSTKKTCGACHNYGVISQGWHFSAGDSAAPSGRTGQPWIYSDPYSLTQIPLSLRAWPGTFTPQQIGMDLFDYVATFGRHLPGGGMAEDEEAQSLEKIWRWRVSGSAEINCLACHDAERAHDASQYALNMLRQNFRWAPTAAAGFATVRGMAADLPDNYDIYAGTVPDQPQKLPPQVTYQAHRFNDRSEVFFDLTRHVPVERCYFCHSSHIIYPQAKERWQHGEDVHVKAGMLCVDCHRHGLDHRMVRGYEGEALSTGNPQTQALTCRGCHLGNQDDTLPPMQGRSGAPKPIHRGIPPLHFDKLSCTTCHSGAWPRPQSLFVKTSQAHALGLPKTSKSERALPHIVTPVYIQQKNGVIAPHHLLWPSFWAKLEGDSVTPLPITLLNSLIAPLVSPGDSLAVGDWPLVSDSLLVSILVALDSSTVGDGQIAYISGGQVHRLNEKGKLLSSKHAAAEPVAWPFAHDVRPAAQSLGVRGCADCHSTDAPIYFGKITVDSPLLSAAPLRVSMTHYLNKNKTASWLFSFSFLFRPWLKYMILFCSLIIFSVIALYAFRGLARLTLFLALKEDKALKGRN